MCPVCKGHTACSIIKQGKVFINGTNISALKDVEGNGKLKSS